MQTGKIDHFPIILFGSEYWSGLLDWLRSTVVPYGNVSEKDLDLYRVCDDIEEIVDLITEAHRTRGENGSKVEGA